MFTLTNARIRFWSVLAFLLFAPATVVLAMDENLEKFLDSAASNQARLQAGNAIGFLEKGDVAKLETYAKDADQPDELRVIAVVKIGESQPETAIQLALALLGESNNGGPVFRSHVTSYLTTAIEFGAGGTAEYRQPSIEVLRGLISKDESSSVVKASLSYLGKMGDPFAEEKLRQALDNPEEGVIDQVSAIGYAATHDARKYEVELGKILEAPRNPIAEAKAVEVLASNPKYQAMIRQKLEARDSPLEVRIAAVNSLSRYVPETINTVLEIAADESQSAALRTSCIYTASAAATRAEGTPELWIQFGVGDAELTEKIEKIFETDSIPQQVRDAADSYIKSHKKN